MTTETEALRKTDPDHGKSASPVGSPISANEPTTRLCPLYRRSPAMVGTIMWWLIASPSRPGPTPSTAFSAKASQEACTALAACSRILQPVDKQGNEFEGGHRHYSDCHAQRGEGDHPMFDLQSGSP